MQRNVNKINKILIDKYMNLSVDWKLIFSSILDRSIYKKIILKYTKYKLIITK